MTSNDVADFFLLFARQHGDCLTNLKIQKLVYYAQAWHLALYGKPLVNARFEAWVHGPVDPKLYRRFKKYGPGPITQRPAQPELEPDVVKHLEKIYSVFGKYSGWDLERMTHAEKPWRKARKNIPMDEECTREISQSDMREFYSSLIKK